jgi:hypothetical protein
MVVMVIFCTVFVGSAPFCPLTVRTPRSERCSFLGLLLCRTELTINFKKCFSYAETVEKRVQLCLR